MVITSYAPAGFIGDIVHVEVDLRRGIPGVDLVGLPDGAVKESRERVRAAVRNSGFDFPKQ
ncbi:MAG TPA: magnesium chelatase domain-containing protein, partial [Spirochaetia bacterium]|nr:magnesium chelatase domain-containing protein [Spirochaetia bacterium]